MLNVKMVNFGLVLLLVILSVAVPAVTNAEMLASSNGGNVFVFRTADTMDYFIKECRGSRAYADDCLSCITAIVTSGTHCSIIDSTMFTRKVRIMQGPHKGKTGWVPVEWVRD